MPTLQETELHARIAELDAQLKAEGLPVVVGTDKAAELLDLGCERTVHRLIARGELRAAKIGSAWKIQRKELATLLARREQ